MNQDVAKKLADFFSQYKTLKYSKGSTIMRADDPIFGIFLIEKGFVRQYFVSEDGDELTINFFRPLAFFPMMITLSEKTNKYYFEATTEVEVRRAPPQEVIEFLKKEPEVLFDLTRRFAISIVGLTDRIEDLLFKHSHSRIIYFLLTLAKQAGQEIPGEGTLITLPLTHKDISTWTGLTRETASRQMEKLEDRKLISYQVIKGEHLVTLKNTAELGKLAATKNELH